MGGESYIDFAQLVLYLFWAFFFGLIVYLRREDKREGYPLEADRPDSIRVQGFPAIPAPKTFLLRDGSTLDAPRTEQREAVANLRPTAPWPGAPFEPTGDPMLAAVGPGSYAQRADVPELSLEGEPKIVPMRTRSDFSIESRDPDPRGMTVNGADGQAAGKVMDVWVDLVEPQIRYLEVELDPAVGNRRVLLPITLAKFESKRGPIWVRSILGSQFASVPGTANEATVTKLEEDRIVAYYGGGQLFAEPSRQEPRW